MLLRTERLTIRPIVPEDWKSIKEIWADFSASPLSQYDKPRSTDDAEESLTALFNYLPGLGITRVNAGTAINNTPSVALLKSLGFELMGTEKLSFYKDSQGNAIYFEGGIFALNLL